MILYMKNINKKTNIKLWEKHSLKQILWKWAYRTRKGKKIYICSVINEKLCRFVCGLHLNFVLNAYYGHGKTRSIVCMLVFESVQSVCVCVCMCVAKWPLSQHIDTSISDDTSVFFCVNIYFNATTNFIHNSIVCEFTFSFQIIWFSL